MRPLLAHILPSAVLGILTTCACVAALAGQDNAKRMTQFAKLPNWSGVWQPVSSNNNAVQVDPAVNPAWLQKHNTRKPAPPATDNVQSRCIWGMPRLLRSLRSFEVTVLPEQTFFSYDINEFRHVWTDGRRHPLHTAPTPAGYSIGHWEGSTLVIDTTALQSGLWITYKGVTLSPKATLQERWSQPDNDHLKVDVTVHDPAALSKPYVFARRYERADASRLIQKECFEEPQDTISKDSSS